MAGREAAGLALASALLASGCGVLGTNYGSFHKPGEKLTTACASVTSFDEHLRSNPGQFGPDSFVAYIHYGAGMDRGPAFLIFPGTHSPSRHISEELVQFDPRHREFWAQASVRSGSMDGEFTALVPADARKVGAGTIVNREAVMVHGRIVQACGKRYLLAVEANPLAASPKDEDWEHIARHFHEFESHVEWP